MKENKQFERGIALFNAHDFFEAHEVWEELWLAEPEPGKAFLQGLIQVAAAFHHHGRGNPRGRESLLAAGIAKLERFPDDHHGLALEEFRDAVKEWAKMSGEEKDAESRKLPQLRLKSRPARQAIALRVAQKKKRGG